MNRFDGEVVKFRVFDRIHKTIWVAGEDQHDTFHIWKDNQVSYYNYQTGEPSILPGEEIPDDGSGYILMRFTEKHDMAGKEVYEGDVIENPDGIQMEIRYGKYQAYCPADKCFTDGIGFYAVGAGLPEMPIGCLEDYATVIGNVWENPELRVSEITQKTRRKGHGSKRNYQHWNGIYSPTPGKSEERPWRFIGISGIN